MSHARFKGCGVFVSGHGLPLRRSHWHMSSYVVMGIAVIVLAGVLIVMKKKGG